MDEQTLEQIKLQIEALENKNFSIYFFVMDTKGNPIASVANIYEHAKVLRELGYNVSILHEKNDYAKVGSWLGSEYDEIPHISAESQELKVNACDFIIIPELFSNVMEQTKTLPAQRIIFCQSYDYILEMLMPGKSWVDFNITKVITTSEKQKEYIDTLFSNTMDVSIVPVSIPDYFKPSETPKKPIIAVLTRDQRDMVKIFKTFYLRHPHLKWITFRDMRNMPREDFAKILAESCMAVWVDDIAGFGTFPLEAMKCEVPIVGKVPNMVPEYFTDKNGLWVHDVNSIPDLLANYFQAWLEDNEPQDLLDEMKMLKDSYNSESQKGIIKTVYESYFQDRKKEFMSSLPEDTVEVVSPDNTEEEK